MKRLKFILPAVLILLMVTVRAEAHFGMLIPSDSMVMQEDARSVKLTLSFSHPFEMVGMELVRPKRFGVLHDGQTEDLTGQLKKVSVMGQTGWEANYAIKRPGAYVFFMEPEPYWEPAEDCYIIHYTKTVVAAFGDDEGWDAPVGLKTEIVPLCKPFGLYAGNVFQGVVLIDGKPAPGSTVEVEYYNQDKSVTAPTDYMITQTIKADSNGVFTYAAPAGGWWGFAALNEADSRIEHNGEKKAVELGAVIWVRFYDWRR
jgi:cobalt/nickel transport protein